jgi:uncharacterized protein YutD
LAALHEELRKNYDAIVDELMSRAQVELKGTLYEQMNEQKILRMRYSNVLDVIIEYVEGGNDALFLQHHIVIFMQRYYVNIDENSPLNREVIEQRRVQIVTSVNMYLRVLKKFVSNQHHARLDQIWLTVRKFIHQMGDYLSANLGRLSTRMPTLKMQGIEYDADSTFDIDPETWN